MRNFKEELKAKACAFIPGRVANKTVVGAMDLMRKYQRKSRRDFSFHLQKNEEAFKEHAERLLADGGYVEDQQNYADMWFGRHTMKFSGCEVFAAYNALVHMKEQHIMTLPRMIAEFEKDGMMLNGQFGTAPKAIMDFFRRHGFSTRFSTDEKQFDEIAESSDSLILTLYNDKEDIRKEVHTVNVSKENGSYIAHNVYGTGRVEGPYPSVRALLETINGGKAKGISLLGIQKRVQG